MSFFDEGDEPTRATSRPRVQRPRPRPRQPAATAATRRAGGGGGAGGRSADEQTLLIRRAAAGAIALVVLLILVFGIKACKDSAREQALKDYNRDVAGLARESRTDVAEPFFTLLNEGGDQPAVLQQRTNQLRLVAEEQAKRARALDVPGEMADAQAALVLTLDLRAGALAKIAAKLPSAKAEGESNRLTADTAVNQIAGQMRAFDASDVIYSQRVAPLITQALSDQDIEGQPVATSRFLPDVRWLTPSSVAGVLGAQRAGGGRGADPNPAPGLHGHGLMSVSIGGKALQPDGAINRIPASANPSFTVAFQNQGDSDESDVVVKLTARGDTGKTITARKTVRQTRSKQAAEATLALGAAAPSGPTTISVTIDRVPGEENTDNNKQSYIALFQR